MREQDKTDATDALPLHTISSCNMLNMTPKLYRLARNQAGEVFLQGGYGWSNGMAGGIVWQTLETVEID